MKIEGSVAFVTGGAQGIGQAICRALLTKGAKVCVADCNAEKGQQTVDVFESEFAKCCIFVECDVSKADDVKCAIRKTINHFGKLDIVACNAGVIMEKDYRRSVEINVIGTMEVHHAALKEMSVSSGGSGGVIIYTASICGVTINDIIPAYVAGKHAVVAHCRCWGTDFHFKQHQVRVNCICPDTVDTPLKYSCINEAYDKEAAVAISRRTDMFSLEDIADGFIKVVEDDGINGKALVWRKFGQPPAYE